VRVMTTELNTLDEFLKFEFRKLGCEQESKWVLESLSAISDFNSAKSHAENIVERRKSSEPLAYILGNWEFRDLNLAVGPGVLIPRPETEQLVSLALNLIDKSQKSIFRIADLGAGSGAITYSIAAEAKSRVELFAVEKSGSAFGYLQKNFPANTKNKIHLIQKDWVELDLSKLDLIVSNPPYVSPSEYKLLDLGVKNFEPKCALVPDHEVNPYSAYESIFEVARRSLSTGGAVLCEFGPAQTYWSELLFVGFGGWRTFKDLSGKERYLYAFDFEE
jgi:release factor glutamine methyltransferase